MATKKVFIDYRTNVNKIIAQWQDELKKVTSLDEYVHFLISTATEERTVIIRIWKIKGYFDNNKGWTSREAMESYIRKSFTTQSQNITWLQSFLTNKLDLSQTEPVHLHPQQHAWYLLAFKGGNQRSDNIESYKEPTLRSQDFYHHDQLDSTEKFDFLLLYQNEVYGIRGVFSNDAQKLLVLEYADKERRKFEKLTKKFSGEETEEIKYERARIPEEVRIAVWRRDQGKCARCGNRENLEYDHIVPVSKGGGNTVRNIELLCQDCNRSKGNRIE